MNPSERHFTKVMQSVFGVDDDSESGQVPEDLLVCASGNQTYYVSGKRLFLGFSIVMF